MTLRISKDQLVAEYCTNQKTVYQVAKELGCDHKTVRSYMRRYGIDTRPASEYNYLCRRSHETPTREELYSPKSVAAHVAYLCEGWHTDRTTCVCFCNTDTALIDLVVWLLRDVYKLKRAPRLVLYSPDKEAATLLCSTYPNARLYIEPARKTPLVRVHAGGRRLGRELVENAYEILRSLR